MARSRDSVRNLPVRHAADLSQRELAAAAGVHHSVVSGIEALTVTAPGIPTVLRLLVPVFVPAPNPTVALQWEAHPIPGGVEVVAHNSGNVHVQIRAIRATARYLTMLRTPLRVRHRAKPIPPA